MRRVGLLIAVLVALAILAVLIAGFGGDAPSSSATNSVDARRDGLPSVSVERPVASPAVDVEGARLAAIDAVAMTGEVVTAGFISRRDLIAGFTTAEFGPRLADETTDQVSALLVELGERDVDPNELEALEQPLMATATHVGGLVQVEVWSVLVVAVPGLGPACQAWRTVTLDMVLVDSAWLVDGWRSVPGPTPALPMEVSLDSADVVIERLDESTAAGGGG